MGKKNFYGDIKDLHKQIVAEIIALMVEHDVTEVDLLGSDAAHAYVTGYPSEGEGAMTLEVSKVYYEDGKLMFDVILDVDTEELAVQNENGDIGAAYQCYYANDFYRIIPCAGISDVYESIYEALEFGDDEPDGDGDKKVFLLAKNHYTIENVDTISETELEDWVAESSYNDNDYIIKIDANGYNTPKEAIENEFGYADPDDYYVFSFGF